MALTYGTIHGDYGDEKVTSTTADTGNTIGTRMILPDGRVFRYSYSNGAVGAGTGVQSSAAVANHDSDLAVASAASVGDKSVSVTLGGTAAAEDLYANGYLFGNDVEGEGHVYRIRQHDAIGSGGTGTINLMDGDTITEALVAGSSQVGLVANPYMHVIPSPGGAQTGRTIGFAPCEVADNTYFWAQTWGESALLADGTLVIFRPLRMSDNVAGAVEEYSSQTDAEEQVVGYATNVLAADTEYQFAFLTISP
jgi:hypothetical protein